MIAGIVIMLIIIVSVSVLWVHALSRTGSGKQTERKRTGSRKSI